MPNHARSRATGADIAELFGYAPDDRSQRALIIKQDRACPFVGGTCSKTNHDQSEIYGVCSVSYGVKSSENDIVICPKRLYTDRYACLKQVADQVWGSSSDRGFVIGGTHATLRSQALKYACSVVAFGQGSGTEVGFSAGGSLSIDWVLQRYETKGGKLVPKDFVCVEIQSIDITGNYREAWSAYMGMNDPERHYQVPNSGHGLNWANVHKRLIPQLIRKGNVMLHAPRCVGFFFVLPDAVFKKFEAILPTLEKKKDRPQSAGLTVLTYKLGSIPEPGKIRPLVHHRTVHYDVEEVALAFIAKNEPGLGEKVDRQVAQLL